MNITTKLKGVILGLEQMGAKFVKTDGFHLFFDVPKGSEIDDETKLEKAKKVCVGMLGLGLKVRRLK